MKTYGGVEVQLHALLTRYQMEVSGLLHSPDTLLSGKVPKGTHWKGGLVGSRAGLEAVVKRKSPPCPCLDTHYEVAHFHYVLLIGTVFAVIARLIHWYLYLLDYH